MIGIVGGVGPLAGLDLARKIVEETKAKSDQDHVPLALLSIPANVPDRTQYLLGKEVINPGYALSKLLLRLESMGASVAAIACNTAHAPVIFERIAAELKASNSQLTVEHLILNTKLFLQHHHQREKIGILSSFGTWQFGLYRNALEASGFGVVDLSKSEALRLHNAIYHPVYGIKSNPQQVNSKAKLIIYGALDRLIERGSTCVVLGCTELPVCVKEDVYLGVPLIDPARVLARQLIGYYG